MIDWAAPIIAQGIGCADTAATVDSNYARKPDVQFVRIGRNLWTADGNGGTWAFNDDGLAVAGLSPDGYEGRYRLVNK